eukprot:COSAG06_NODE_64259_length_260_cov_0.621118_1_plen_60_part_10
MGGDINPLAVSSENDSLTLDGSNTGDGKSPEPLRKETTKIGLEVLLLEDRTVQGVVLKRA